MQKFALVVGNGLIVVAVHMKDWRVGWRNVGDGIRFLDKVLVVLNGSADETRLGGVGGIMINLSWKIIHSQKVRRAEPITNGLYVRGCFSGHRMRVES